MTKTVKSLLVILAVFSVLATLAVARSIHLLSEAFPDLP
jgi:hypothetical protein